MRKRELPKTLVKEFWSHVSSLVRKACHVTPKQAREATDAFRRLVEPKVGDMIYHANVEDLAKTISHGIWWERVRCFLIREQGMPAHSVDASISAFLKFADAHKKENLFDRDAQDVALDIAHATKCI